MKNDEWVSPKEQFSRSGDRLAWGIVAVIAIIVLLALMAKPAKAEATNPSLSATSLELEIGQTNYHSNNGVWFDTLSGPYQNNIHPTSWQIALRIPGWRVGFTWLGTVTNTSEWGAHELDVELAHPEFSRASIEGGRGKGEVAGIWIGKSIGWNLGPARLDIEGGPFLYYRHWREEYWPLSDPSQVGVSDTSSFAATLYGAATVRYGYFIGEARIYRRIPNELVGGSARQFLLGVSVPF